MKKNNEKNKVIIALNTLFARKEKIYPAYSSKHDSNPEKQVILLMIPNDKKHQVQSKGCKANICCRHYLAAKKLSALLGGITSKHHGNYYCLNHLHSFATKKKLKLHKNVCKNEDFCNVIMLSGESKIFEFNQISKIW